MVHIIIENIDPIISYDVGPSARSTFPVPFAWFEAADIVVTNNGTVVSASDYTLTGTAVDAGFSSGSVELDVAVTNVTIVIERILVIERVTDFPPSGPFSIPAVNTQFDRNTAVDQQLQAGIDGQAEALSDAIDLFTTLSNDDETVTLFATRDTVAATDISPSVLYLRTAGLHTVGDGLHGLYVPTPTPVDGGVTSLDGRHWRKVDATRQLLTANTTFYVRKDGSNTNTGTINDAAGAWLTIQYGLDWIGAHIDRAEFAVIVQVGDGTYAENVVLPGMVGGGRLAQAQAIIQGNAANHSAVLIQPASFQAVVGVGTNTGWLIKNLKLAAPGSQAVYADYMSVIALDGVVLGDCNIQAHATNIGAFVEFINNPYQTTGTFLAHAAAINGGQVLWQATATCSPIGTPVCNASWLQARAGGIIDCSSAGIFTGLVASGTGNKFDISYGGIIRTSGDLNPNAVLPSGLTDGIIDIWPVQFGVSFDAMISSIRQDLQVGGREGHGDGNYTILPSDAPFLQLTAPLTAPRTWFLPLSSSLPAGSELIVSDAGGVNGANTLTLQRQGSDTLVGIGAAGNAITIGTVFGAVTFRNDAAGSWYVIAAT